MKLLYSFSVVLFFNILSAETFSEFANNDEQAPGLHYSISHNRPDFAETFIKYYPHQINASHEGKTAFELALESGNEGLALLLLENGFNPNFKLKKEGKDFISPAYLAIKNKSLRLINKLFEKQADFSQVAFINDQKISGIRLAVLEEDFETIRRLLKNYTERDPSDEDVEFVKAYENNAMEWPALHYAISIGDKEALQFFLNYGYNVNESYQAPSAYHLAMQQDDNFYKEALLKAGFDPSVALQEAITNGSVEAVQEILDKKLVSAEHFTGAFPNPYLLSALKARKLDVAELLIQNGFKDSWSGSFFYDQPEVFELLLSNSLNEDLFINAFYHKQHETCRVFLEHGYKLSSGELTLNLPARQEFVPLLHEYDALFEDVITSLIRYGEPKTIKFLLDQGYLVNERTYARCVVFNRLDLLQLIVKERGITEAEKKACFAATPHIKPEILDYISSL